MALTPEEPSERFNPFAAPRTDIDPHLTALDPILEVKRQGYRLLVCSLGFWICAFFFWVILFHTRSTPLNKTLVVACISTAFLLIFASGLSAARLSAALSYPSFVALIVGVWCAIPLVNVPILLPMLGVVVWRTWRARLRPTSSQAER